MGSIELPPYRGGDRRVTPGCWTATLEENLKASRITIIVARLRLRFASRALESAVYREMPVIVE